MQLVVGRNEIYTHVLRTMYIVHIFRSFPTRTCCGILSTEQHAQQYTHSKNSWASRLIFETMMEQTILSIFNLLHYLRITTITTTTVHALPESVLTPNFQITKIHHYFHLTSAAINEQHYIFNKRKILFNIIIMMLPYNL